MTAQPPEPLRFDRGRRGLLDSLNPAQRQAASHPGGPLLVLAGAGSGKTRVITHRIAWLIVERGVAPGRVVAVTFTNKAAAEMRERVQRLLGSEQLGSWIGTFHALCLRMLRQDGARVGLAPGFNIYDTDDQLALIKRILKDEGEEGLDGTPRSFLSRISRAKNALQSRQEMLERAFTAERRRVCHVWERYEEALQRANAVDFDDLLLRTLQLFADHPEVAAGYASRCEHLLVDEYQDTNRPQYLLVRALSAAHGNVCVVGDEDQSIYRFRGADLRNILDFGKDQTSTHTVRLEQNYRSTATILAAANAVVSRNVQRLGKNLWTENDAGERIELFRAPDDRAEATWVAQRLRALGPPWEEAAVLYRTNAQSRLLEEIFRRDGIPYQVVGSLQFYERKEIKDLLAYLKLTANPVDDVAFRRVVNAPPRGIGDTTLQQVESIARDEGVPLAAAARLALERGLLATRPARMLRGFVDLMTDLVEHAAVDTVPGLIERIVAATHYEAFLTKTHGDLASERIENIRALISAAVEYTEESDEATLLGFLDRSALSSDADEVGREPGVTLMTVHCAKGLEFSVVFLVGLEENLFPHAMSQSSDDDIEEERRLCYVAMTRARRRLLLAHAGFRRHQGNLLPGAPSRFIDEIPPELIDEQIPPPTAGFFDSWSVRSEGGGAPFGSSAARAAVRRHSPAATPAAPRLAPGPAPADGFRVGVFVRHPQFGSGRVLAREGDGAHLKLTIQFGDRSQRKILPAYTQLLVER